MTSSSVTQPRVIRPRPRRGRRNAALAAVVLVPLAFAGLVVGAVSQVDRGIDAIPAAIVNNDTMITTTLADGTEQQVLAGRQLVTELTGDDAAGFTWTITNSKDAKEMLAAGEVYAVLEVPKDFSKSILSLSSDDPQRADLAIRTDDAHNYLTGSVAQTVGDGMADTFGKAITAQYIGGLYSSIGALGGALSTAADGATQLSDGAGSLASGLNTLTNGAASAQTGASALASGVGQYAAGVTSLSGGIGDYTAGVSSLSGGIGEYTAGVSSLSAGLGQYTTGVSDFASGLRTGATETAKITASTVGVTTYTKGVSDLSAGLTAASAALDSNDPAQAAVQALVGQLATTAAGGPLVSGGVDTAFSALAAGADASAIGAETLAANGVLVASNANTLAASGSPLASGAATLAASGASLASGASTLSASGPSLASGLGGIASGLSGIQTGASSATDGASSLATGVEGLATGLADGAAQVPTVESDAATEAADVATTPVDLTVTRDNEVSDLGQIVATFFVPLGLWIGSLAVFLVLRPATRAVLTSTAGSGRIVLSAISRAFALTAAQAVLLTALLHVTLGVSWSMLPATLLFSLVMALAFTTIHYLLTVALGRAGLVVSLFLLAIQITATGGLYPIQVLAQPFQAVSPFLPLTYGVAGMQAIISGSGVGSAVGAVLALVAFGLLSVLGSLIALARIRRARALGLVPAAG